MTRVRVATACCLLALVTAACGRGEPQTDDARRIQASPDLSDATPDPLETEAPPEGSPGASRSTGRITAPRPTPAPGPSLADARVGLTQVANLNQPLAMQVAPNDDSLYVAEKGGRIRVIRGGQVESSAVLDISSEVSTGGEQGLLGLAFSPDGQYLYVNFTNRDGNTVIREYRWANRRADVSTARAVLGLNQPRANHNGGDLQFGRDGKLYISTGDGGGSGDPDNNAQDLGNLLGKILRIEPRPAGSQAYSIPADNPFVGRTGARGEIWAYGLRNPWRFSFDRANQDLYIADVGQNAVEEVNWRAAASRGGENYGWNRLEGSRQFQGSAPADHVLPIYEYERVAGHCAVTGGYVYRGQRIPALAGAYVFADFCKGELRAFVQDGGRAVGHRSLGVNAAQVSAFGQDAVGEIYVMSLAGPVYRIDPV
ncbi:MAG TPA: PQQ-dependent sugar dehydrogenase [Actinomycetota bacterium]|nr:PQQ-dependent sugar dehydrogenase [Actinomycetota bacterium]